MDKKNKAIFIMWAFVFTALFLLLAFRSSQNKNPVVYGEDSQKDTAWLADERYILELARGQEETGKILEADIEKDQVREALGLDYTSAYQTFYITRQKNGHYSIVSTASWKYLGVDSQGKLCQYEEFRGEEVQLWDFSYVEKDFYRLKNLEGGWLKMGETGFSTTQTEDGIWKIHRVPEEKTEEQGTESVQTESIQTESMQTENTPTENTQTDVSAGIGNTGNNSIKEFKIHSEKERKKRGETMRKQKLKGLIIGTAAVAAFCAPQFDTFILQAANEAGDMVTMENQQQAESAEVANGYYAIVSAMDSTKLLHTADNSSDDDVQIEIWDDSEIENEIFYIEKQEDGYYKIINSATEKSLNVRDASSESGVELQQKTYDATDGQKWDIQKTEDGHYTIKSALGNYLDCAGGSTDNGNRILLCSENGQLNQKWDLYKNGVSKNNNVRSGVYTIASAIDINKQLCVSGGSDEEDTPVVIWDNDQYDYQSFYVELQSDGYYKIISSLTEKSLAVKDASTESGAVLEMKTYDATPAQQWTFVPVEDGSFYIQSALSTYIDCAEANTENGNQMLLCTLNRNTNQKWFLLPQGHAVGNIGEKPDTAAGQPAAQGGEQVPATVESGLYQITSAMDSNKALHIAGDSGAEGAALELLDNSGSGFQTFFIGDNGDGTYKISSDAAGGMSLDVKDASPESGAVLQMRTYDMTAGQSWQIVPTEDGQHYYIKSSLGTCLDCSGASSENGTPVNMFELTGGTNQKWNLQRVG